MAKCNTQANDMATMANNWQTPGASNPGRYTYIISKVLGNNSYYLIDAQKPRARKRDDSGKETERPWNANLLRRFYS